MPRLVRIAYRQLAAKLRRAGYEEIRTSRHPVYYLAEKDITIPVPRHPGDSRQERSAQSSAGWA
jgi:hypothetical protein